jgi:hypothetical protein
MEAAKWSAHGCMTNRPEADRRAAKWNRHFAAIGRINATAYVVRLQPATAEERDETWPAR